MKYMIPLLVLSLGACQGGDTSSEFNDDLITQDGDVLPEDLVFDEDTGMLVGETDEGQVFIDEAQLASDVELDGESRNVGASCYNCGGGDGYLGRGIINRQRGQVFPRLPLLNRTPRIVERRWIDGRPRIINRIRPGVIFPR